MASINNLRDKRVRLIFIPLFGVLIPNLTGVFEDLTSSDLLYWLGYIYFIFLSFLIWHGNRFFLLEQRKHFDWFSQPFRKVGVLLFANVFYTAPITVILLMGWYKLLDYGFTNWHAIQLTTLVNVIVVIFITHVYETVYLIKQREQDLLRVERTEKSRIQSELQALKSQIDPHFMFNTLNTLSHLIETDAKKAFEFNQNLSDIYRYIIQNKERNLVMLEDEITFLSAYYSLLKIRFGEGFVMSLNIRHDENYLIPPISIQLLLENAVKHNSFSATNPLMVQIKQESAVIEVKNNKSLKISDDAVSGTGLKNLNERMKLVMNKSIEISDEEDWFIVRLPLLKLSTL